MIDDLLALYNSRPKDSTCSISDLTQFVRKVGTIQDLYDSLQVHLTVANLVTSVTNSNEFGERWQRERELLEGDNIIDTLRELLWQEVGSVELLNWKEKEKDNHMINDFGNIVLMFIYSVISLILFIILCCTQSSTAVSNQRIMKLFEESFYLYDTSFYSIIHVIFHFIKDIFIYLFTLLWSYSLLTS